MDALDRLAQALYRREALPEDYLGGSTAHILDDAAEIIELFLVGDHDGAWKRLLLWRDSTTTHESGGLVEDPDDPSAECNNPERLDLIS